MLNAVNFWYEIATDVQEMATDCLVLADFIELRR